MKVLVFGASGRTGRELVKQALVRGLAVTGFVRDPARLPVWHVNLRIAQGDVSDTVSVTTALAGQDAVISTLGVGTPLKHDPAVNTGVRLIIHAMEQSGPKRLIYLSFLGVSDSRAAGGFFIKHIAPRPLRHEIADHEIKEGLIKESRLDWTIVRPPKLTNGRHTGTYRSGEDIATRALFPTLSRADVADFMLRQLTDDSFVRKAARLLPG